MINMLASIVLRPQSEKSFDTLLIRVDARSQFTNYLLNAIFLLAFDFEFPMTLISYLLLYRLQTQSTSCYLLSQDSQVNGFEANKLTFEQRMQNVKASKLQIIQFCRIELDATVSFIQILEQI